MKHSLNRLAASALLFASIAGFAGCEDDGGGSSTRSGNPDGPVVAMGDSITAGVPEGGTPYPSYLAGMTGKPVINAGSSGEHASEGANRIAAVLGQHKPSHVLILYGANDVLHEHANAVVINALIAMIGAAWDHDTTPVIATIPRMPGTHEGYNAACASLNNEIRQLAKTEKVKLVDIENVLSGDPALLLPDGLHPMDAGNEAMARAFAGAL